MRQKILRVTTTSDSIRGAIDGWDNVENPNLVVFNQPIGSTRSEPGNLYDCVLRAMADGWRLLGPPTRCEDSQEYIYSWWLYKDVG